jgi:hypothetical protein
MAQEMAQGFWPECEVNFAMRHSSPVPAQLAQEMAQGFWPECEVNFVVTRFLAGVRS